MRARKSQTAVSISTKQSQTKNRASFKSTENTTMPTKRICGAVLFAQLSFATARAQEYAELSGTVNDLTGAVIPIKIRTSYKTFDPRVLQFGRKFLF